MGAGLAAVGACLVATAPRPAAAVPGPAVVVAVEAEVGVAGVVEASSVVAMPRATSGDDAEASRVRHSGRHLG